MADPVLKFPPEQKGSPAAPRPKMAAEPRRRLMAGLRRYRRFLLLVVLPLVTALGGINPADAHRLLTQLEAIKENVRNAIQNPAGEPPKKEQHYG